MVGGPSIVFTRKAVVDETFLRDTTKWCKSLVGIDAGQLYPFSMCQAMPTNLYTRWELDQESGNFELRKKKTRSFEIIVMLYLQRVRPQCKAESFFTRRAHKEN